MPSRGISAKSNPFHFHRLNDGCGFHLGTSAFIATLYHMGPGLGRVGTMRFYGYPPSGEGTPDFYMLMERREIHGTILLFFPQIRRMRTGNKN
ncbi:MAG: hypothetical protein COV67_07600 [Nitrospinae bacterium CG11_big_fil_rev_8_21_14_0_20_56_8]|nr:MAG: hypothetical protein COV67_07600 [Nitrospinae bacterium CG11_big_fil_rev_8_21_14_0_20_56_8]